MYFDFVICYQDICYYINSFLEIILLTLEFNLSSGGPVGCSFVKHFIFCLILYCQIKDSGCLFQRSRYIKEKCRKSNVQSECWQLLLPMKFKSSSTFNLYETYLTGEWSLNCAFIVRPFILSLKMAKRFYIIHMSAKSMNAKLAKHYQQVRYRIIYLAKVHWLCLLCCRTFSNSAEVAFLQKKG